MKLDRNVKKMANFFKFPVQVLRLALAKIAKSLVTLPAKIHLTSAGTYCVPVNVPSMK